jgi:hypothetical protein
LVLETRKGIQKGSDPLKLIRDEDFGDAPVEVDLPSLL